MTVTLRVGDGVAGLDALSPELVEWETVSRSVGEGDDGARRAAVLARALRLAAGLADARGEAVLVLDGAEVHTLEPEPARDVVPVEPTPWVTGVALAGFTALLVVVGLLAITAGVAALSALLAVVVDIVVVGGLAPSAWLARDRPVWRWVSLGAAVGTGLVVLRLVLEALT